MKFKGNYNFKAPMHMVQEAREKRFENPEQFPEMKKHEEIDRKVDGQIITSKRKIELASSVPGALKTFLSPDMLKCIDTSVYNLATGEHTWDVKPTFKTDAFTCKGYSKYTEYKDASGEVNTKRELELTVTVTVPFVGKIAEQFILDAYKKNVEKDNKTIEKMITIMKERESAAQ